MAQHYQIKSFDATVKDIDSKQGIVTGYFASFGNVDSDGDMIMPGAFKKTVKENGPSSVQPRIKHLKFHDPRLVPGVLQSLYEDSKGLYFESKLSRSQLGRDTLMEYEDSIITEHSIGFVTISGKQLDSYYEMRELKLWEGSSVTWGANSNTPATGVKSLFKTQDDAVEKIEQLTKAIRNGKYSDETFHILEIQLKQIQQYLSELSLTTEPDIKNSTRKPEPKEIEQKLSGIIDKLFLNFDYDNGRNLIKT